MVRGRRKINVKMRVNSVNGGRKDEGERSKKERDKEKNKFSKKRKEKEMKREEKCIFFWVD